MTEQTNIQDVRDALEYDIKGMKVAYGSPTYGPVNSITAKYQRVAIMYASNRGVVWVGDGSPDRMGYGGARNTVVQYMLKTVPYADGVMWVDSDIRPEANQMARLLDTANHNKLDFVTGVYFQRGGVHNPVFYAWNKDKYCFQPAEDFPHNTLGRIDGCGFGFVYTSSRLLRDIAKSEEFDAKTGWFPDKRDTGGFGEDLSFCYLAKQAGHQLWVDTGIIVAHEGDVQYVLEEDFRREQAEWVKSNKDQKPVRWGVD